MTTARRFPFLLILVLLGMVVSGHALLTRPETGTTRAEMWESIRRSGQQGGGERCEELIVASCRNALTHDPFSVNYGKANPHLRVSCCEGESCTSAIIGLRYGEANPVLVTVIPQSRARLIRTMERDGCDASNWSAIRHIVGGL